MNNEKMKNDNIFRNVDDDNYNSHDSNMSNVT